MLRVKRADLAARGVERVTSGIEEVRGRPAGPGRPAARGRQRRLGHRLPAGLRLDPPAGLRRGRLPEGVARRRRGRTRAVLLRPELPVLLQLDADRWRRARRGVRRGPDRRALKPPREEGPGRRLTAVRSGWGTGWASRDSSRHGTTSSAATGSPRSRHGRPPIRTRSRSTTSTTSPPPPSCIGHHDDAVAALQRAFVPASATATAAARSGWPSGSR